MDEMKSNYICQQIKIGIKDCFYKPANSENVTFYFQLNDVVFALSANGFNHHYCINTGAARY